jgi:ABC-2 type transport system permease protein
MPRHSYERLFESRFLITFLVICAIWPAVCALIIYVPHNETAMLFFKAGAKNILRADAGFFMQYLVWQSSLAFMLTAFVAPGLISSDLANNALPLYFSRPFSRTEYVIGKMAVITILLSAITWVPGLALFAFQAALEPGWLGSNLYIAWALFAGSWMWILLLCVLGLALSAWVRWRIVASALLFMVFFLSAGFGAAINNALNTKAGSLINLSELLRTVLIGLFRVDRDTGISPGAAWTMLIFICAGCVYLLNRKVRAFQVERS